MRIDVHLKRPASAIGSDSVSEYKKTGSKGAGFFCYRLMEPVSQGSMP